MEKPARAHNRRPRQTVLIYLSLIFCAAWLSVNFATGASPTVPTGRLAILIKISGAISPAVKDYFERALRKATEKNAALFIIQLDTPGGLVTSMRDINQAILSAPLPVVTYVAPSGARAASAGTYMMYASHFAVMAPATNLGAATPVQLGGLPGSPGEPGDKEEDKKPSGGNRQAMENKAINDSVAYIRGLAELRDRNADWAEQAVREAASLSSNEALKLGVIDFIASDLSELFTKLNGKRIAIMGRDVSLNTEGMVVEEISPDWRSRLLSIITDPNVAYILMLIGIYGLIFEFSNPGAVIPGVAGAICLLIALYAFQVLPVNYAGLALILLGVALMVAEAFAPSFGALGIGGIIAFVIGSVILMNTDVPGFGVSLPLIVTFALISSLLFTVVLYMAIKSRKKPVVSGQEELLGAVAEVLADFDRFGRVRVHSEVWNALSDLPLRKGQRVRVTRLDGLTLNVEPITEETAAIKLEENKS